MNESKTQLLVIGGGPGGYAAAFLAADLGMQVTLVNEEADLGGVCLNRGCIPSKALLHAAKVINEAREAQHIGLSYGEPKIDIDQLRSFKNGVIDNNVGGLKKLAEMRKVNRIYGRARLLNATSAEITAADGGTQRVTFENCILATGSRPTVIPAFNLDTPRVMNSTAALELKDVPKSLLVIGGGYIGLELGTVYSALGSEVTVVEMTSGLLPGADRDLVAILQKRLQTHFKSILLNTKVAKVEDAGDGIKVLFESEGVEPKEQMFDKVLVSVGRTPNSQDLGLENTNIQVDRRGFVPVNVQRQSTEPTIWAIGDIAGEPMLAHKASHEGRIAVEAIAGHAVAFEPNAIPAVIFTDPEIAWCGLTETEAKKQGIPYKVAKFPWGASGRAMTLGRPEGLTKMILEPETERVLGIAIAGVGAGELIAEGVLAIEMAASANDIRLSIHAHPTLSETVMESAEVVFGQSTHTFQKAPKVLS
jgi:dihydrolipoamide dehydrogenase